MEKRELIFVPAPGMGHIVSMVELAKRLIDKDYRLSITLLIINPPFPSNINAYIQSLSSSFTPIRFIHINSPMGPPPPDNNQAPETLVSLFIESCKPLLKHTIIKLISSESIRLSGLFIDLFFTTLIDVGNELGVPTYLHFTSGAGMLGLMLHLPTLHTQITSEFKDSETELIVPSFVNPVPPTVLPSSLLNKKNDAYEWFLYHSHRFRETKGIIVNTFYELEPGALNAFLDGRTPPVYPVGPLLDLQPKAQMIKSERTDDKKIMSWLDNQPSASVVLLCFGSMGGFSASQVKEIAIGLERSECRFLWSLRQPPKTALAPPGELANPDEILPIGFLDRTEERGLVCGWIPQVDVLAHHAIGGFISHCGWNSILESLWFGVPILTWPLYAEQQLNAFELVRELGLAVELRLDYRIFGDDVVMAEEVERGVKLLMDGDNEVRKNVKEMSRKSRNAVMDGGSSLESLGRLIEASIEGPTVGQNSL